MLLPHTLVSNTNVFPGERERGIPDIAFSGEYTGIFLEVLVQHIICSVLEWQPASAMGFNIGGI